MRRLTIVAVAAVSIVSSIILGVLHQQGLLSIDRLRSGFASATTPAETGSLANASPAAETPVAAGSASATASHAEQWSPRGLLKQSRDSLISHQSIKAQLVQETVVEGRRFRATGTYLQGRDLKLRLEFHLKIDEADGSLLEVCDGQILWTRQSIAGEIRITRRDVRQILDSSAVSRGNAEAMLRAEFGLGGLPAVLASLERSVDFTDVREQVIDAQNFLVLRGQWSEAFLAHWKPAEDQPPALPSYLPDEIRIYLDRDVLFPRRFLYLKRIPGRTGLRPLVTLDITEVVLNAAIDDSEFFFVPPDGSFPVDVTNEYLQKLARK